MMVFSKWAGWTSCLITEFVHQCISGWSESLVAAIADGLALWQGIEQGLDLRYWVGRKRMVSDWRKMHQVEYCLWRHFRFTFAVNSVGDSLREVYINEKAVGGDLLGLLYVFVDVNNDSPRCLSIRRKPWPDRRLSQIQCCSGARTLLAHSTTSQSSRVGPAQALLVWLLIVFPFFCFASRLLGISIIKSIYAARRDIRYCWPYSRLQGWSGRPECQLLHNHLYSILTSF